MSTTYYLSPTGNDANDGLSPQTAARTIAWANALTLQAGDKILFEAHGTFSGNLLVTGGSGIEVGVYGWPGRAKILCGDGYGVRFVDPSGGKIERLHIHGSGVSPAAVTTSHHAGVEVINTATSGTLPAPRLHDLLIEHCYAGYEIRGHSTEWNSTAGSGFTGLDITEILVLDTVFHAGRVVAIPLKGTNGEVITWDQYDLRYTLPKVWSPGDPARAPNHAHIYKGQTFFSPIEVRGLTGIRAGIGDPERTDLVHTGDGFHFRNCDGLRAINMFGRDCGHRGVGPGGHWIQECRDSQMLFSVNINASSGDHYDGDSFDIDGSNENCWGKGLVSINAKGAGFLFGPYPDSPVPTGGWVGCVSINDAIDHPYLTPFYDYGGAVSARTSCHVLTVLPDAPPVPLPAGYELVSVNTPGGTASYLEDVSLAVNGVLVGELATHQAGSVLEFKAIFADKAWQHVGFTIDFSGDYIIFSTRTGGALWARTNGIDTQISGSWLGAEHTYRIEWDTNEIRYYVDGDLKATHARVVGGNLRTVISDYNAGGDDLIVNWITPPTVS